jgi:hypothetical protein
MKGQRRTETIEWKRPDLRWPAVSFFIGVAAGVLMIYASAGPVGSLRRMMSPAVAILTPAVFVWTTDSRRERGRRGIPLTLGAIIGASAVWNMWP